MTVLKRIATSTLIIGLLVSPGVALAHRGGDDNGGRGHDDNKMMDVRREDRNERREDRREHHRQHHANANSQIQNANPAVPITDAIGTAQASQEGKIVVKAELKPSNDGLVWRVTFTDRTRVIVDADDGRIVQTKDS